MSRNFFLDLFNPQAPADEPAPPSASPSLAPIGSRSAPSAGAQLSSALTEVAEQIADREVRELRELQDSMDCRFQIWTLTFHVSIDNEAALRNLMALGQRDDGVAKTLVERAFAKTDSARWLNTLRMKIEFKRGDHFAHNSQHNAAHEPSEVLMVCGRDSVPLPFSYTGQIEVVPAAAIANPPMQATADRCVSASAAVPGSAPSLPLPASLPASLPTSLLTTGPADELLLWAQLPGQRQLQRWSFKAGTVQIGAAEDATLCVNQHHVSGEHLQLTCDEHGHWQVMDRSRNGSNLLDASADAAAETPLPTRVPRPLPRAGALRLGPLPDDPLLHFHITPAAPPAAAAAAHGSGGAAGPRRRVTQLADATTVVAWPQPGAALRRSTGLS